MIARVARASFQGFDAASLPVNATTRPTRRNLGGLGPVRSPAALLHAVHEAGPDAAMLASADHRCPPAALAVLSATDDLVTLRAVAGHLRCPPAVVAALSRNRVTDVRGCAAGNRRLPARCHVTAAEDSDMHVRKHLAANPHCGIAALRLLAADQSPAVAATAAKHPAADSAVIDIAARGLVAAVVEAAVESPNCAAETLVRLARTGEPFAAGALSNPAFPASELHKFCSGPQHARRAIAANPACPPAVLESLAEDSDLVLLRNIAANPQIPVSAQRRFAAHSDYTLRRLIASSLVADPALLASIVSRSNEMWVLADAAMNPRLPPAAAAALIDDDRGLGWLAALAARNPACPSESLRAAAQSSDPELRVAAALNPRTPPDIRRRLAEDPVADVRASAHQHPAAPPLAAQRDAAGSEP